MIFRYGADSDGDRARWRAYRRQCARCSRRRPTTPRDEGCLASVSPAEYECGVQSLDCRCPPRRSPVLACRRLWPEVGDVLLLGRIGRPGMGHHGVGLWCPLPLTDLADRPRGGWWCRVCPRGSCVPVAGVPGLALPAAGRWVSAGVAIAVSRLRRARSYNTARPHQGIAQRVPDTECDIHPATVTNVDARQIHRKPVLNGLINEYARAA